MQPLGIAKLDTSSAPQLGQMGAKRMVKKLSLPAPKKVALTAGPPGCPLDDYSDTLPGPSGCIGSAPKPIRPRVPER